jgi:hypothetical protein
VCKDNKRNVVYPSKKDQGKWEAYPSKHGLNVKKDIWSDRPQMTINWLRPFLWFNSK